MQLIVMQYSEMEQQCWNWFGLKRRYLKLQKLWATIDILSRLNLKSGQCNPRYGLWLVELRNNKILLNNGTQWVVSDVVCRR